MNIKQYNSNMLREIWNMENEKWYMKYEKLNVCGAWNMKHEMKHQIWNMKN